MSSRELAEWQAFYSLPHNESRLRMEMQTPDEAASQLTALFKGAQNANTR